MQDNVIGINTHPVRKAERIVFFSDWGMDDLEARENVLRKIDEGWNEPLDPTSEWHRIVFAGNDNPALFQNNLSAVQAEIAYRKTGAS